MMYGASAAKEWGKKCWIDLKRWIESHGNVVHDLGDSLEIEIPWSNTITGSSGVDRVKVRNGQEARAALGY